MSYWQSSGGGAPQVHDHSDASEGGNIPQASVTDLAADLAGKADTGHGHVAGDITGLQAPSDFSIVLAAMLERGLTPESDFRIEQGDFIGLYLGANQFYNGWSGDASNAIYTIPTGKVAYVVAFAGLDTNDAGATRGVQFMRPGFAGTIIDRTAFPNGTMRWALTSDAGADGLPASGAQKMLAGWTVGLYIYGDGGGTYTAGGWVIIGLRDA